MWESGSGIRDSGFGIRVRFEVSGGHHGKRRRLRNAGRSGQGRGHERVQGQDVLLLREGLQDQVRREPSSVRQYLDRVITESATPRRGRRRSRLRDDDRSVRRRRALRLQGADVLLLRRELPGTVPREPGAIPQSGRSTRAPRRSRSRVHVPDASGGASEGPGSMPDLRHGARAGRCDARRRAQSGTGRHDATLLGVARPDGSDPGVHDRRAAARASAGSPRASRTSQLDRVRDSRRQWCYGADGRSSSAAGPRSSAAISTCSR